MRWRYIPWNGNVFVACHIILFYNWKSVIFSSSGLLPAFLTHCGLLQDHWLGSFWLVTSYHSVRFTKFWALALHTSCGLVRMNLIISGHPSVLNLVKIELSKYIGCSESCLSSSRKKSWISAVSSWLAHIKLAILYVCLVVNICPQKCSTTLFFSVHISLVLQIFLEINFSWHTLKWRKGHSSRPHLYANSVRRSLRDDGWLVHRREKWNHNWKLSHFFCPIWKCHRSAVGSASF